MNNKKILKYFFLSISILLVIGFFLTFDGYTPNYNNSEDVLSPEQQQSIEYAAQDKENLTIFGDTNMQKETFDPAKLTIQDLLKGTGAEAMQGNTVTVHYTGTFLNGEKFDSSLDRNRPFSFKIGGGQVIAGWEQGLVGMKVGGKRKLVIPPNLAYGAQGVPGAIPSNATLIFEIELLNVDKN